MTYNGRTGLNFPVTDIGPVMLKAVRLTIPARDKFEAGGAAVAAVGTEANGNVLYTVTLAERMPAGLIGCSLCGKLYRAIRCDDEPSYPNELPDLWLQVDLTPCPECEAPIVWYEAGYVSGYRICTGAEHHHLEMHRIEKEIKV